MAANQQELLETFGNMSVIELSEFVEAFKDRFNVTAAAAPVMAMAGAAVEEAVAEEQDEFEVVLESFGAKKIQVIKVIRQITSLGLKEAKELVDKAPSTVREAVTRDEAEEIRSSLEAVGATVIVK
jgi:large subunit ribosomal protein L7/L12